MKLKNKNKLQLIQRLGKSSNAGAGTLGGGLNASIRRKSNASTDLMALDKLVTSLLERQQQQSQVAHAPTKLGRLKSLSLRDRRTSATSPVDTYRESEIHVDGNTRVSNIAAMPTILESSSVKRASLSEVPATNNMSSGIRHVINTIKNAPHRFSHGEPASDNIQLVEENTNLKQNILD